MSQRAATRRPGSLLAGGGCGVGTTTRRRIGRGAGKLDERCIFRHLVDGHDVEWRDDSTALRDRFEASRLHDGSLNIEIHVGDEEMWRLREAAKEEQAEKQAEDCRHMVA